MCVKLRVPVIIARRCLLCVKLRVPVFKALWSLLSAACNAGNPSYHRPMMSTVYKAGGSSHLLSRRSAVYTAIRPCFMCYGVCVFEEIYVWYGFRSCVNYFSFKRYVCFFFNEMTAACYWVLLSVIDILIIIGVVDNVFNFRNIIFFLCNYQSISIVLVVV